MEWLLFSYSLPPEPSRKRVFLWRRLKKLGALSMEGGGWLLPKADPLTAKLEELSRLVEEMGGKANLYIATHFTEAQERRAIVEFQASRERECAEIIGECHKALRHIERETGARQFTFEEVEELEGDLDKIRRWFVAMKERDFWGTPMKQQLEKAIAEVELALAGFTQKTYEQMHEGMPEADTSPKRDRGRREHRGRSSSPPGD